MTKETKLICRNITLIILTAGVYLIWLIHKSGDSEFIPLEDIDNKE